MEGQTTRGSAAATAVPFLDLWRIHEPLKDELLAEISALIDSGRFLNGPQVAELERAFADYCGAAHCVGMSSGLDALRIALLAAGLEPGDEVILPAMTFVATAEAVTQAGGVPVLADVTEDDYGLDREAAEAAVSERTSFLLPVHLYGLLADVRALGALAERRGLGIVEDACQAHGAERDGVRAGAAGLAAAFSFYPSKNLGAMGDAGALVTRDAELAERARALREHGQRSKYRHESEGYTARLDTLQALVVLRKLAFLDGWNAERRAVAARYAEELAGVGDLRLPPVAAGSEPVWYVYVVRTGERDALAGFLRERGVETGIHYPEPVHLTGAYARLGYRPGSFPVSEALARECLSLPVYPGMTDAEVEAVVGGVRAFFGG